MAGAASGKAVVFALVGNTVLTITKFIAYMLSGSNAMLAEAIHSGADTGNQALLLIGIKKSEKEASSTHQFGYKKDQFIWALLSAAGIFFIGCGVTVTHGVHALLSPHEHEPVGWVTVAVLAFSFVLDGYVLSTAVKELNHKRNGVGWIKFLKTTDDTTTVAVLFEDGAATLGVVFAAIGIFATQYLHLLWADAAATIAIGLLLGAVAIFLAKQNRDYLLDRSVGSATERQILDVIKSVTGSSLRSIYDVKTRILGDGHFKFNADVVFDGKVLSDRVQERMNIEEAYGKLTNAADLDKLLDEHARVVVEEIGREIDRIERAVQEEFPGAALIEIEVDVPKGS